MKAKQTKTYETKLCPICAGDMVCVTETNRVALECLDCFCCFGANKLTSRGELFWVRAAMDLLVKEWNERKCEGPVRRVITKPVAKKKKTSKKKAIRGL